MAERRITIVGAGLAGALLATLLAQRGWKVDVYEKRGDPRVQGYAGGRSINLALAERGRHALRLAGGDDEVMAQAVMMRGRMVHFLDGRTDLQRYGKDDSEVIWSVHRGELNLILLDIAEKAGAKLNFHRGLASVDFANRNAQFRDDRDGSLHDVAFESVVGADGAGSALRAAMTGVADLGERTEFLGHSYKELEIPPGPAGGFSIEPNALHIWPRGRYMCIALPNDEHTFTVTLFLPNEGDPSFATVRNGTDAQALFERDFADAVPLIPNLQRDFEQNPTGLLATLYLDELADRRSGRAARGRCARDGAVPWPGHELRFRGLRGAGEPPGAQCGSRRGLRRLPGRAPAERARNPADGAGELPGDARPRRRRGLPAATRARADPGRTPSRPFRAALRDGDVPSLAVRGGIRAWAAAARAAGGADAGPCVAGHAGLGTRSMPSSASA
jgi:kynurenine 3-monooxygenase